MASEDQDILAQISQLAGEIATAFFVCMFATTDSLLLLGQINRHKNGQQSDQQTKSMPQTRIDSRGSKAMFSFSWTANRLLIECKVSLIQAQDGDQVVAATLRGDTLEAEELLRFIEIEPLCLIITPLQHQGMRIELPTAT